MWHQLYSVARMGFSSFLFLFFSSADVIALLHILQCKYVRSISCQWLLQLYAISFDFCTRVTVLAYAFALKIKTTQSLPYHVIHVFMFETTTHKPCLFCVIGLLWAVIKINIKCPSFGANSTRSYFRFSLLDIWWISTILPFYGMFLCLIFSVCNWVNINANLLILVLHEIEMDNHMRSTHAFQCYRLNH